MHDVVPRFTNSLDPTRRGRIYGRVPRDVARAVEREHGRGMVVAARVNAAAHVARTALINTGLLSHEEEQLIQLAPLGEARYKAIVDAYAIWAAGIVGEL